MSDEIIKVMDILCEKFGIAIDWTAENVMPYFQQLMEKFIRYEIATSVFIIVELFLVTVISLVIALIIKRNGDSWCDYFDDSEPLWWVMVICFAIAIIAGIVFAIIGGVECADIITCVLFPEKKIIEYIYALKF